MRHLLLLFVVACTCEAREPSSSFDGPYVEERARFETNLVRRGPSPQEYDALASSEGIELVRYRSGAHEHQALLANHDPTVKRPALLYLHGGFALGEADVRDCQPFVDAGWVVFAPSFRGENGNPGFHELYFGEVDDARAALEHLRALPGVIPEAIVVFGHSAGGVISSLLALYPDLDVLDTGSAGGLYDTALFGWMPIPFEDTPREREIRLALPHLRELRNRHFACFGADDEGVRIGVSTARAAASLDPIPIEFRSMPGDHFDSLRPCMRAFLRRVSLRVASPR
ncbi:MAG: alpha/beta fold hydrolase [Polyangiales bacterium]